MKTYKIFNGIALLATGILLATPQLLGRVFVTNQDDKKPADWLSHIILSLEKSPEEKNYDIPNQITVIKFIDQTTTDAYYNYTLRSNTKNDLPRISYAEETKLNFHIQQDTLYVKYDKGTFDKSLTISLQPKQITEFYFENIKNGFLNIYDLQLQKLHIDKASKIDWIGRNSTVNEINLQNQSSLQLFNLNQKNLNIHIDNSIVNVSTINQLDSVHAHLTGKSNIKSVPASIYAFTGKELEELETKAHVKLFPTGDLTYVKRNK